jgi:8-oxo-dGTP pyrophosphatase MutT (NUDIX family)
MQQRNDDSLTPSSRNRRAGAMLGGLWEFPGGKRRRGESVQKCIRRDSWKSAHCPSPSASTSST